LELKHLNCPEIVASCWQPQNDATGVSIGFAPVNEPQILCAESLEACPRCKRDEPKDEVLRCESIKLDQANDKVVKLYILNRTVFCKKLREWYDGYVKRLRDPNDPEATDLRQHFVAGIEHVVEMCRKSD